MTKQRNFNKPTHISEPTSCRAIYKKTLIKAKSITAIAWLEETYHTFLEFQKMLSFQIVHLMNQTMTFNTLNLATMIITIKIAGVILYVTDNAFANMVLHLNTKHFDKHYDIHISSLWYTHFIVSATKRRRNIKIPLR